uniref:Myb/SANT-like domain-containing protein n=1 Tax=Fagus sylvatica TaxID=28930 RepID=A0A2N9H1E1_FAGSY
MNRGRLIAPYRGVRYHLKEYSTRPPQNAKELFNLRHASLRNAIERAFGVLKKRFPIIGSTTEPTYSVDTQTEIILACCIIHNYLMGVDPDERLIAEVDEELLQQSHHETEAHAPREDDEDARQGEILRDSIALAMWQDYDTIMGKKSKKDGGDPSKEVQWTSVMDDALVDALLYQLSIGARVNGTFNSRAYDEVVKELVAKFDMDINKDKSKPAAKKWMATPIPNYFKMAQLWAKDRATGDHAETAKEKRARYATSTTIDGIDLMVSQNEVSLENFEVEESDQMKSPEINVVRSRAPSQEAFSSKSKKKKVPEDGERDNVISRSFDNISMAMDRATEVMEKCFMKISGTEIYAALQVLDLEPTLVTDAYIFLMDNAKYKDMFFGCPVSGRKDLLLKLMSKSKN